MSNLNTNRCGLIGLTAYRRIKVFKVSIIFASCARKCVYKFRIAKRKIIDSENLMLNYKMKSRRETIKKIYLILFTEKVFSFLSKDEVEKLQQEEERKIATLRNDKKKRNNKLIRNDDDDDDDDVDGNNGNDNDNDDHDDDDDNEHFKSDIDGTKEVR